MADQRSLTLFRAKFGESAFLDVYQKLYEAPDPGPALALALGTATRIAELEAQTRKMAQVRPICLISINTNLARCGVITLVRAC